MEKFSAGFRAARMGRAPWQSKHCRRPARPEMKEILNRRIKHRKFSTFGPSIVAENTAEYFENRHPSPFYALAYACGLKNEIRSQRRRTWTYGGGCKPSPARPIRAITRSSLLSVIYRRL